MSVHAPMAHDSARLHVTGAARYVDDIPTPQGCLHLAFALSPVARGVIRGLDIAAMKAAPGVVAVLVAADLPFANDVSPSVHDEPLLATDRVHYMGQPVALVVADTHLAARKAARLLQIEIEAEPPSKGSCDEECGENSVKEELGGNLTVGAGVNKGCICECKKDFRPGGLERPACKPKSFVCTEAAKEALKLPNAGVVTCGNQTSLKPSPPNESSFDTERAAQDGCCERISEVEPSVTF